MKVRDSGMPEESWWSTFFDPEGILRAFGLGGEAGDVVEFGCGYGTFTLPAARLVSGTVHALDIEPALVEMVKELCSREGIVSVEMEAAALLALGKVLDKTVVCLANITNTMATRAEDFEKGGDAGLADSLSVCVAALGAALEHGERKTNPGERGR